MDRSYRRYGTPEEKQPLLKDEKAKEEKAKDNMIQKCVQFFKAKEEDKRNDFKYKKLN